MASLLHLTQPFLPWVWDGDPHWPMLHLEDLSAIPFVSGIPGASEYQHRARVRAGTGDCFVATSHPPEGYEAYCRDFLQLGEPTCLVTEPVGDPLLIAEACRQGRTFEQLVEAARQAGRLAIHPYMAHESVWRLAEDLQRAAGVPVCVMGPPPPVTWLANDKAQFSALVAKTVGPEWLVPTTTHRELPEIVAALRHMAREHPHLGIKRTRCASATGNQVWRSADLLAFQSEEVHHQVAAFLAHTGWQGDEEVLVVAWEISDCSPSTQLWIPPLGSGDPRVDGIYEQVLEGETKCFLGSRPSTLGTEIDTVLVQVSLEVARALQAVGYVGRCSFDFIVNPQGRVRFVECNGRWGGTSTPMRLVDRITAGPRPTYYAQDVVHPGLVGMPFQALLERLETQLYDPRTGRGRYVLYNAGPMAEIGKLDVIAFGDSPEAAMQAVREAFTACVGL